MSLLSEQAAGTPRRWLMWSILALSFAIVYIHRVAPNVVADHLMETFAVREGAVLGSLAAMYFYIYAVMQLPSGLLADTLGTRFTVTAGMALAGAGSLLFGSAPTIFYAFVGRFLVGLGVSIIFVSILKFQAVWFAPGEFAFLTGLTILVGNAGAVVAATPLALVVSSFGWRFSFSIIGLVSFLIAAVCLLLVRDYPPGFHNGPQGCSLSVKFRENVRQMVFVFANKDSWPPFLVAMGVYGTLIAFSGVWGIPYLMQVYGFGRTEAANLMLAIAVGMMAGSPAIGYLSDRLQCRKVPYVCFVLLYTACWAIMVFWRNARPPVEVLYPLYFLLGFFGSVVTLTFAVGKEVNPPGVAGMAVATLNIGGFLGISILQPLLGYLLDLRWEGAFINGVKIYPQQAYFMALRFCLYPLVLALLAAALIRETGGKNCYRVS